MKRINKKKYQKKEINMMVAKKLVRKRQVDFMTRKGEHDSK